MSQTQQGINSAIEALLPVNCAYNFSEEARDSSDTEMKCYSTTCMLNVNKEVASDIQKKGCKLYQRPDIQEIIKNKK